MLRKLLFILGLCTSLFALDPKLHLSDYNLRSYPVSKAGSLAETPDGFLWLGSTDGLIRFDGIDFSPVKLPSSTFIDDNEVRLLKPSRNGGLWIGTAHRIIRLLDHRFTTFTSRDGLPEGIIMALVEDRDGVLWVGTAGTGKSGLVSIKGNTITTQTGLPSSNVLSLFQDESGALWVGTTEGVCHWLPEKMRGCAEPPRMEIATIAEDKVGTLIIGDAISKGVFEVRNAHGKLVADKYRSTALTPKTMLLDHEGSLWIGTYGQGLLRVQSGKVEQLTQRDGLSGDVVLGMTEDSQGNLWIGTDRGLDRLREPLVSRLSGMEKRGIKLVTTVSSDRDGSLWVGTVNAGLFRIDPSGASISMHATPSLSVLSAYEDLHGSYWFGTTGGLIRSAGGRTAKIVTQEGGVLDRVFEITGDTKGAIWIANAGQGLLQVDGDRAKPLNVADPTEIYSLHAAKNGLLWVGYDDGKIKAIRVEAGKAEEVEGEWTIGWVRAITEDASGIIWAGTEHGISRFRNGRWTQWGHEQGLPEGGVHSIITDDSGMWASSSAGLIHVPSVEFDRSPDGTPLTLDFALLGPGDGIVLAEKSQMFNPQMTLAGGRLVLTTKDGVRIIDPRVLRRATSSVRTVIDEFTADQTSLDPDSSQPFVVQDPQRLNFHYTAPNLSSWETMRFRYMLEGVDREWIEAGALRQVTYGKIPPGLYRFRVDARGGGVTQREEASVSFRVRPPFLKSWYFLTLCCAVLTLGLWGWYRYQIMLLNTRLRVTYQERLRLTRELHDTLLQGFAGVVFQLDAAYRGFRIAPEDSQIRVKRALEQADQSMAEARRAISLMRLPALENQSLSEALTDITNKLVEGTNLQIEINVVRQINNLPYRTQANLLIIGRELLINALSHGKPSRVRLSAETDRHAFKLTVQDDGIGFDPEKIAAPQEGHIGLSAIRERVADIRATMLLESAPGRGTRVEISGRLTAQR